MPRFEYQFETRMNDSGRLFRRRLRIVVLFILISAATAGIIWWIIPKGEAKVVVEKAANDASTVEEKPAATQPGDAHAPEKNNTLPDAGNAGNVADKAADDAGETVATSSLPEKGKIWAGDPVADVPVHAENKNLPSKLDVLKALQIKNEYKVLAEKALDVMQSENEGSEIYRIAAKYLLEARVAQLASNTGVPGISYRYTVRGGDTLSRIARRNKTTISCVMRYNRLKNGFIRIGRKFIIHKGAWNISISKSKRLLKLFNAADNTRPFAVFEVGVGRMNSTPAGGFVICSRIKDPEWHAPDGSVFGPGDPGNELGGYFLKLAATGNPDRPVTGYGIHGTPDDTTVGKSLSKGCIRMRKADVELLYNLVPEKTPVNITE